MKILVCVKQTPDVESRFRVNEKGTWFDEQDLIFMLNEYDSYAAEEAVRLKEKYPESTLSVLTIGPKRARDILIKVMGMGADRGIHILDEREWARDPYQKASVIAQHSQKEGYDIIFFGLQSQDRGSGQVGLLTAGMLGFNCVTGVVDFECDGELITAKKEMEGGVKTVVRTRIPAVITCQSGLNHPRYVSLMNRRKAQRKEIKTIPIEELLAEEPLIETEKLYAPERKSKGVVLEGDNNEIAEQLIKILADKTHLIR